MPDNEITPAFLERRIPADFKALKRGTWIYEHNEKNGGTACRNHDIRDNLADLRFCGYVYP